MWRIAQAAHALVFVMIAIYLEMENMAIIILLVSIYLEMIYLEAVFSRKGKSQ